jgi:hypothetical protein
LPTSLLLFAGAVALLPLAALARTCAWTVDHAGWVVTLHSPDAQTFPGKSLTETLAWCLVWLMAPEIGIDPFLV